MEDIQGYYSYFSEDQKPISAVIWILKCLEEKKGDSPVSSILSADGHIVCTVAPREADRLSILILNFGNIL